MSFFAPSIKFQENKVHMQLVHHLAQLAHCYIQRKVRFARCPNRAVFAVNPQRQIGSGFDIAAACFGSQRYRRFPSSILSEFTTPASLVPADIAACLMNHAAWDVENRTVSVHYQFNAILDKVVILRTHGMCRKLSLYPAAST